MISKFDGTVAQLFELQIRALGKVYLAEKNLVWALKQKKTIALQYKKNDELVGVIIIVNKIFRPWSGLYFFVVDKKHHSIGVGSSLLSEAEKLCLRPKLRLFLRKNDMKAIGFFESKNYILTKIKPKYYSSKLDALVYAKKL